MMYVTYLRCDILKGLSSVIGCDNVSHGQSVACLYDLSFIQPRGKQMRFYAQMAVHYIRQGRPDMARKVLGKALGQANRDKNRKAAGFLLNAMTTLAKK